MPNFWIICLAVVIVTAGALVQGGVGFGLGVLAAPTLTLLYPSLMPGALLVAATVLPMFSFIREARHTDWRGLSWAFAGRIGGTAAGAAVVAVLPARTLGAVVGGIVLAAVALTATKIHVVRNPGTLLSAGFIAGTTATAAAIGGPPIALVYQRDTGPRIRSTLAVFFCAGSMISLAALAGAGHLPGRAVAAGAAMVPFVAAGFALSNPLRRYLDSGRMRASVLALASIAALILIVRNLF